MILENVKEKTINKNFEETSVSDTVKILEISNFIDEWEQGVLFSSNGFYSLKGKNVSGKTQELLEILERDIDKIFEEMTFESVLSKQKAFEVKSIKIKNMRTKMEEYEKFQKESSELEISNQTIESAKTKACAYKMYPEIIEKCYMNALSAISIKALLKNLGKNEINSMIKEFNSGFFEKITKSFIDENSKEAEKFYLQNKNYISEEKRNELEDSITHLKNKQEAFQKANDFLFSDLKTADVYQKISKIKNDEIKKYTKIYYDDFINSKENTKKQEDLKKSEENWGLIDECLKENSDLALFKADMSLGEKERNAQIEYIKTMIKQGRTETDNKTFFELFKTAFEVPQKYNELNLYEFRHLLSREDFDFFVKLKEENKTEKFFVSKWEFCELSEYFDEKNDDFNVSLIKIFKREKETEEKNTKKEISLIQTAELLEKLAIRIKKWDSNLRKRGESH